MNRVILFRGIVSCIILLLQLSLSCFGDAADKPNIVLIMADDMGYTDIGCYGSEIQTPVLDDLAERGIRFTQFYNTSRCCPTRAALLTGLYSHQAGIGLMTGDRGHDAYRGDLNRSCVTIAEALKPAGYRNYMSGKWHVTRHTGPKADQSNWPMQRGFDRFYGTITGAGSFYDPATLCRGNKYVTPENDPEYQPTDFYYTDAISDNAARYVADHFKENSDDPFFLYVAYTSAHWPMHAPEAEIKKYDGVYDQGYDPIRQARYQKAIAKGVINDQWPMSAAATNWGKSPNKDWDIRCMEVYAAMVDRMDQGIGRIVDQLRKSNALDNTIIVYLQDNGGCAEGYGRANNDGKRDKFDFKPLGPDGLQTKIWPPMQTRDGRWVRSGPNAMPGAEDTFVAYGTGWANTSNTPFRGYKHDAYEGGISTPFIVHWPAGIPRDQIGTIVDDPAHLIDLMPTFVDAAGASYPTEHAGESIEPTEGISLIPTFTGKAIKRDAAIGFEHHGNLALRDGRWKIVSAYRNNQPRKWELYDMQKDRTEQHDLSKAEPERLQEMVDKWQSWADRVGVQPWPFTSKQKQQDKKKPAKATVATEATEATDWNGPSVTRFGDAFDSPHDFLADGLAGTDWSGFLGKDEKQTADRISIADGKLFLKSTNGRYQEPWSPLGPLLYKTVSGDFRATVRVVDYEMLSFNNGGIMARAAHLDDAGAGEDWISIDYFPLYGGIYGRMADDNRRSEPANNGQGKKADKYLQLERAGNQFFLRHSADGKQWTDLPKSPMQRDDLAGVPLQVGLFQATYSNNSGEISFDDFKLEQLPPVKKSRVLNPPDGATHLPRKLSLNWVPGAGVKYHDIYLSTSREAVAEANRETKTVYQGRQGAGENQLALTDLADGKTYYWRVDEVSDDDEEADNTVQHGDVWSFATYDRNILTFEDDQRLNAPHSLWKFEGPGGARAPTTQDQPRSGKHALLLDTTDKIHARASFVAETSQDWDSSAHEFRSLKVRFRGEPGNKISALFVGIEDEGFPSASGQDFLKYTWRGNRSVVNLKSSKAFSQSEWTTWTIDLRQLVKNHSRLRLDSVKKISFESIGHGKIAIDDVSIEYASDDDPSLVQPDRFVTSVPFDKVKVTGGLWRERMDVNRTVSLPHVWGRCETSVKGNGEPSKRLDNFLKAGGLMEGPFTGTYFNDSDVYKIIEGTANSLKNHPDEKLETYTDKVIDSIAAAQWDDGYLYTFYSLPSKQPQRRWKNVGGDHELYCAGHLIESAIAYHEATGKRKLLDVAVRFTDLICRTFAPGRLELPPGHQEIELALIRLYESTGDQRYKDTAKFFIDQRGRGDRRRYGTYSQDHLPFTEQEKGVGHSVRAGYLFCAATDIARIDGDEAYANSLWRLWDDILNTKTYITGGIGQPGGPEGFAGPYQLGNSCYAETCSGIAFAMWNHRLHLMTGDVKYADLIERTFLNNMLSSLSAKGDRHYYTNPLTTNGRERWHWPDHDCACCPSNLVRVISSISGYIYSHKADTINVNQFIASEGTIEIAGGPVKLTQKTNYPWDGDITIDVRLESRREFEIRLRMPGWSRDQPMPSNLYRFADDLFDPFSVTVNGNEVPTTQSGGYVSIRREWKPGDQIKLMLPMPVRRIVANPKVEANKGLVAIQRGPIVYCAEFADNDFSVEELALKDDLDFSATYEPDLFGGVTTIRAGKMKLIPYYLYANRGKGWMRVWMPRK